MSIDKKEAIMQISSLKKEIALAKLSKKDIGDKKLLSSIKENKKKIARLLTELNAKK